MNLDEAIEVGLSVPEKNWLDMSPTDTFEDACRVMAQHLVKQREILKRLQDGATS